LPQTIFIEGDLTIHGIKKNKNIKATIEKSKKGFTIYGNFDVLVSDYQIKIPVILSSNIAKKIQIQFRFQYENYEE
ncbi:MAG: YceI family protein, partial [Polaribacter sp.]|nr:YceI family protein [Polaribacter sp.]